MDSLGLFSISGGAASNVKIVKAGSASITNNQTQLVSVSSSWDYGVITGGCYNTSDVSYCLLFPVFLLLEWVQYMEVAFTCHILMKKTLERTLLLEMYPQVNLQSTNIRL